MKQTCLAVLEVILHCKKANGKRNCSKMSKNITFELIKLAICRLITQHAGELFSLTRIKGKRTNEIAYSIRES
ncbi:hypothetical protein WH96_10855 [Kiloniella spongiae]|uniref:Uncharacterized protein n=1 Tax=Kiloniella spongiae TaxID=1489064 RepID=A0A0H2MEJ0_9PROT|nr:hypothetical protein WH96_10855 [Kiloniella spongiae]